MSVKIQTRSINPTVFNDLLTAGADPLIARLCAARDVQSPAELDKCIADRRIAVGVKLHRMPHDIGHLIAAPHPPRDEAPR